MGEWEYTSTIPGFGTTSPKNANTFSSHVKKKKEITTA
jgi:hypothetical protein